MLKWLYLPYPELQIMIQSKKQRGNVIIYVLCIQKLIFEH